MFLLRLVLWIVTLPIVIVAYVFRFVFMILLSIGRILTTIFGGLAVIGGVLMILSGSVGEGIGAIVGGVVIYAIPYIGAFLVSILDMFIGWVRSLSFG